MVFVKMPLRKYRFTSSVARTEISSLHSLEAVWSWSIVPLSQRGIFSRTPKSRALSFLRQVSIGAFDHAALPAEWLCKETLIGGALSTICRLLPPTFPLPPTTSSSICQRRRLFSEPLGCFLLTFYFLSGLATSSNQLVQPPKVLPQDLPGHTRT